jgi:3-methyladenine DNA glycosylase AlkC
MELFTSENQNYLDDLINNYICKEIFDSAIEKIEQLFDKLYKQIPTDKKISFGRVHVIKKLSEKIYLSINENKDLFFKNAVYLFENGLTYKSKCTGLTLISYYGLYDFEKVLPYFISAGSAEDFDIREVSQMLFRKITNKYPDRSHKFLMELVKSDNSNTRRFVSETLRPVCENKWFFKDINYSLSILKFLFTESNPYPRTSVGNNLSDISKKDPELILEIVTKLVDSGDKNSYWIAYRACRNLIKKYPERVMSILNITNYKYKDREYNL